MPTTVQDRPTLDEALASAPTRAPLVKLGDVELTPEQIELIKNTVAKGATDDELKLFIYVCNKTQLDPFTRQIHAVKRRSQNEAGDWVDTMTHQIGIDGQRLISERSGKYRGMIEPEFFDQGGHGRTVWLDAKQPPRACRVGILHRDFAQPVYATALYEEFVQRKRDNTPNKTWKEKPTVMLAKCAEAMARRIAFPQELSGLYVHEEMPPEIDDDDEPRAALPVTRTAAVTTPGNAVAQVSADGDVKLTFGTLKDRMLSTLTREELTRNFIGPWKDETREATAAQRLGTGFVAAVKAAYAKLPALTAEELAAQKIARQRARYDALIAKRSSAGGCTDDELEEIRCYEADHPAEPKGDGLTRAGEQVGIPGL
jgi:phage recombination protein Bet